MRRLLRAAVDHLVYAVAVFIAADRLLRFAHEELERRRRVRV